VSEPQIDIRPDHWAIVRDILQRHVPQYAVWAFGSRAKWTAKEYSDLDLAIITDSPLPLATSAALAEDFSESDLPWKVDIVDWAETSETFKRIIERDRVVVQGVWAEVPLSELTSTPATYGVVQPGKSTLDGVPMLRVNNFQNDSVNLTDVMRIAPEIEEKYERTRIQAGDVLLTIVGSVGQVAIASEELAGWNIARAVAMIRPKSADLSRWIAFALRSPQAQHQLGVTANTTVQTTINLKDLRELKIPFPKEKDRRAITQILGSLDDRIELNRRMNETLEAMARSLFNSWFVNFDGVPADDMQESELGLIPKGWRIGEFEELLVLQRGFDLPTQARISGQFPVIAAGGINGTHNEAMVKGPGVVTGRSGVLGNVYFELGDFWPLNTTLWVKEFRIAKPCYAYELLRGFDFKLFNSGSAVPTLNRNHIHHLPQIIPPAELINDFEKEAMTLRQRMDSNERESQALAQLRDTLLPKLISGEVRIKDAERLAETA
jgi:type I restriction enzyme S subunit